MFLLSVINENARIGYLVAQTPGFLLRKHPCKGLL